MFSRVCIGFFFRWCSACSPAVAVGVLGGKILSVACPFPVKNVTGSISRFYQFCITIALRLSAKKDILRKRGKRKNVAVGKPCGGRNKGITGKEKQPELSRLPVCFLSIVSEKVIIFGMLHYILNIAMQNVA